jgi:diacylglycerol kinase
MGDLVFYIFFGVLALWCMIAFFRIAVMCGLMYIIVVCWVTATNPSYVLMLIAVAMLWGMINTNKVDE